MSRTLFKTKLSSIAIVLQGQSPESKFYSINEGTPFLQGNRTFGNLFPTFDTYTKKITKLAKKGEVLMSVRAPVGDLNFAPCDVCIGRGLASIKAKDGDNKFVYYALKYNIQNLLKQGAATTFDSVNKDIINDFQLIIPKEELSRTKASAILSVIDEKIELNNCINAELESIAKTIFNYWFLQFNFPNEKGKPYKSSGGKMVWNKEIKKEIPEGWEVKNLFNGMDVQYGFPFSTTKFTAEITDKPIVRIRDILKNTISVYTTEDVDEKYKLLQKDLLIGMDGNFHLNFWDKNGSYLNQRSVRIRAKENSNISVFQAYLELTPYIKAREKNISRTTVGHLSDKDLKRLFLVSPNKSDNFRPREVFDTLLEKLIMNRLENQKLSELRDWLLPMLMNGHIIFN